MKKRIVISFLAISLLAVPLFLLAANPGQVDPELALDRIFNWLFRMLLIVAGICIVLAAFFFVTAAGKPEQADKGKMWLLYAIVGVVLALISRGIVTMVETTVTTG